MADNGWIYSGRISAVERSDEWAWKTDFLVKELACGSKAGIRPLCPCSHCRKRQRKGKDDMIKHLWSYGYMSGFVTTVDFAEYERESGRVMRQRINGKEDDGIRNFLNGQGFHPHVDNPIQEETDVRALVVGGRGREHGRLRCLNQVIPRTPELSLTRIKATLTADGPVVPPPRQTSKARAECAIGDAYDAAMAEYSLKYAEWEEKQRAYKVWERARDDADERFYSTGERMTIQVSRPPMPDMPPRFPTKEDFTRVAYVSTPGSGHSGATPFGRADDSPSRTITPFHHAPGASPSPSRDADARATASPSSGHGSTAATQRRASPILTRSEMDTSSSREI